MSTAYIDPSTCAGPFGRDGDAPSPNVLFVTYDMVPRAFWDPEPGSVAAGIAPATPALDQLRSATRFTNAWCTSPLCAPSRAAFLTGRHSYITTNSERAHDGHEHALRASDSIFPEYLKAAGYRIRHVGKCHVGAATFVRAFGENDRPWDRWSPPWYDDEEYAAHLRGFGLSGFRFAREIVCAAPDGGRGNSTGGWIAGAGGESFPEAATYPAFTAGRAIRSLDSLAASGRPFYLQVDFFEPHQPFALPAGLEARERELRERIHAPGSWTRLRDSGFRGPPGTPRIYDLYRAYWGLRDERTVVDYLVAHVLQFEVLERQTARIFARLKELGLWENTMVVLCADHGEANCEDALVDKGAYLNPRVLRVPLFLKEAGVATPGPADGSTRPGATTGPGTQGVLQRTAPGDAPGVSPGIPRDESSAASPDFLPGTIVDEPVSLLDIAPTILESAGIRPAARMDGRSLREAVRGERRPADKPILFEVWTHVMPNPCVGGLFRIGDADYCYTFNAADEADEFYVREERCSRDTENRIDDPALGELVADCRERLLSALAADRRWVSWESFFRLKHRKRFSPGSEDLQRFVE